MKKMKAYNLLKELPDYKKNQGKIEVHIQNYYLMLKTLKDNPYKETFSKFVLKKFQETISLMTIEDLTKNYLLNHIRAIYRKSILILILIIPIFGFSQSINTNIDLKDSISVYYTKPILYNKVLSMEAIDCSKLEYVNAYLETNFKSEDVLKKGVEIFRNEPPYQSRVFLITINGNIYERIFTFNENTNLFEYKKL